MHVLYLHQYFVDPSGSGGTRSLEFARRLVRDGHTVTIVTSTAMMSEPFRRTTTTGSHDIEGIRVVTLPVEYHNAMGPLRRLLAFGRFAARSALAVLRVRRPDVIIATSTPLTIIIPAVVARLRHRVPIVFEVRDLWPEVPIAMGYLRNPLFRHAAVLLERFAYRMSTTVIALSPDMVAHVERIVRGRRPVVLAPNASDIDLFAGAQPESWPGVDPDALVVLYAGTLGRANDVGWLVDVAEALPDDAGVQIVIAGDGAERDAITARAAERSVLGSTVVMLGTCPKLRMPALLASADLCLTLFAAVPALRTTSPNKFFDALAAGRAVATNYGGWQADVIRAAGCGLELDRDPATAARQLAQLARDRTTVAAMGERAGALARSTYDREIVYRRWSSVVVGAGGSAG